MRLAGGEQRMMKSLSGLSTIFSLCFISMLPVIAPTSIRAGTSQRTGDSDSAFPVGGDVEREISGDQVYSFQIELVSSQYLRIMVESSGLPIEVKLIDPDGKVEADRVRSWNDGATSFSAIARSSGVHSLEVHALGEKNARGFLRLRMDEMREATAEDEHRIRAERLFSEAERLRGEFREESSRKAIETYEQAAKHWLQVSDRHGAARAKWKTGSVFLQLGALEEARRAYQESLGLGELAGIQTLESEVLSDIGYVNALLGENERALDSCRQALSLARAGGHTKGEAKALNCLGEAHYHLGKLNDALAFYNQAQPLWRSLADAQGQAQTLLYLGYSHSDLSEFDTALDHYQTALSLWTTASDKRGQALTLVALGRLHFRLGENQRALNFFSDAMKLVMLIGDNVWEASISAGMGSVYLQMGEYPAALNYMRRTLGIFRSAGLRMAELETLLSLGEIVLASGDHQSAIGLFDEALALSLELENARWESQSLGLLGMGYRARGESKKALEYYQRALSTMPSGEDRRSEAQTLRDIGQVYEQMGDPGRACEYYERALTLSRSARDPFGEANGLYSLAHAEQGRNNLHLARTYLRESLRIVESLRAGVESPDLRASYLASIHRYYELYIDVLMRLHESGKGELAPAALQIAERARARSLLESLAEARVDIHQGVDPALLERERHLGQAINAKAERQIRLLSGEANAEAADAISAEIQELALEYEQLQALIRSKSPRYAALTQPRPLNLEEIQQEVLDEETLLLEYSLGEERSYLWAVKNDSYTTHELPAGPDIEKVARRVYELLTARHPLPEESVADYRARVREADLQYWKEAAHLTEMILEPVKDLLKNQRLLIVNDGALHLVSFGALPIPGSGKGGEGPVPLVLDHEIVNMPSASTLAVLREETAKRKRAEKTVAVIADPVFETDDPRLSSRTAQRQTPNDASVNETPVAPPIVSDLQRALRDVGFMQEGRLRIPRLPSTGQEANGILAAVSAEASFKAVDFQASRETAVSPELGRYRIVHFATHGLLNNQHPELSGIILSMVDEQGRPQDGFLRLHDIYNLELPVDLVVLSACNSALGKEVRGEGLIGIVRGFMYAGAERVVASLWKVDDEATGELMKHFYHGMLKDNLAPAAALRQAQIAMWKQKEWRSPFYWAAFVLQGEYR